jgi:hypothetical protein
MIVGVCAGQEVKIRVSSGSGEGWAAGVTTRSDMLTAPADKPLSANARPTIGPIVRSGRRRSCAATDLARGPPHEPPRVASARRPPACVEPPGRPSGHGAQVSSMPPTSGHNRPTPRSRVGRSSQYAGENGQRVRSPERPDPEPPRSLGYAWRVRTTTEWVSMLRLAMLSFWHVHAGGYARQAQQHPDTTLTAAPRPRSWAFPSTTIFTSSWRETTWMA